MSVIRHWLLNPPMGQVVGGWFGAMIVLGIAGGWLSGPAEVRLHTVPGPSSRPSSSDQSDARPDLSGQQGGRGLAGRPNSATDDAAWVPDSVRAWTDITRDAVWWRRLSGRHELQGADRG